MFPTIYHSVDGNAFFEIDLGKEEFIHSITLYNRSDPDPSNQVALARRWNGYQLRCLDAARAETYKFPLVGEFNGEARTRQTFIDFPAIELQRRRPFNSFAVPVGLPAETTLGGVETRSVRYIRIDGGGDFLQLSQVAVFNINNVNVARGKMPTANTTAAYVEAGMTFSASYATDGSMEARVSPRVYSSAGGNGVFEIDLGREELLNRIVIYNRAVPDGTGRDMRLLIARRWTGYSVRCLDSARVERYKFAMQGTTGTGAAERPNMEQSFLFSPCPTKCSDKTQVERLVDEFNNANANAKIIKVLKAWTPKPNRCDFEVEMMRTGAGGQKTFSKETTFMNVSRDGNTCSFKRDSDGSANINSGTYIQATTPDLQFDFGGGFGRKGLGVYEKVTDTVKGVFGTMAQTLQRKKPLDVLKSEAVRTEQETRAVMAYVAANQTLKGCPTKCNDPSILGAIGARYNAERGVLKGQFGAERSVMKRILRSVGGSDTECDVLFEEEYEMYDDALYPPTEKETRTKVVRVKMADAGGCKWGVATGADAIRDVSGAAVGLLTAASQAEGAPYVVPTCNVDCRLPANLAAVKAAAGAAASSTNQFVNFRQVTQSFRNGSAVCEYKVLKDVTDRDAETKASVTDSDVETYLSATFKLGTAGTASCVYTLDTVQEFPPDDIETRIDSTTGDELNYLGSKLVQPPMLFGYDPETAVSKLVNVTPVNM
jgi:hypothetical protein